MGELACVRVTNQPSHSCRWVYTVTLQASGLVVPDVVREDTRRRMVGAGKGVRGRVCG